MVDLPADMLPSKEIREKFIKEYNVYIFFNNIISIFISLHIS